MFLCSWSILEDELKSLKKLAFFVYEDAPDDIKGEIASKIRKIVSHDYKSYNIKDSTGALTNSTIYYSYASPSRNNKGRFINNMVFHASDESVVLILEGDFKEGDFEKIIKGEFFKENRAEKSSL